MNRTILLFIMNLLFYSLVYAGEWPVYSPAHVVSIKDIGNTSLAEIPIKNIIINDKVECSSSCNWTVEMISRKSFLIWNNSQPGLKQMGQAKKDFEFPLGILKLLSREEITVIGTWIFSNEPPNPGDKFYISVTSNGELSGKLSGGYCDFTGATAVWRNYHSGLDIGEVAHLVSPTPTPVPGNPTPIPGAVCHIYPVRSGEIIKVELLAGGDKAIIVKISEGVYDWYSHVQNDIFNVGDYSSHPISVEAAGLYATRLSSLVNHPYPHLHYGVYSDDQATEAAGTKSLKNPLHNLIPYTEEPLTPPAVIDNPSVRGICLRPDDHGLPTTPSPFRLSTIHGNVDIEAKMLDFNGAPSHPMGVNQIGYHLYSGFGSERQFRESRLFMNHDVLCGEPGQHEYSPYYFDEYGLSRIGYQTLYGQGQNHTIIMHNYFYIITNNQDVSGGKAGLSTEGSWNTEETILTPVGEAQKYPDGPYTILVRGADIRGGWSDDLNPSNTRSVTVLND